MIITKQQQNGLQVYDDNSSVKNLSSEKLQSMKNYYIELIDSIKEKNNCLPNGKYTTAGNEALGPVEGVGFFYDDGIKYGSYYYPNGKSMHEFTSEEMEQIHSRLMQIEAALTKKGFLKATLEKIQSLNGRKK